MYLQKGTSIKNKNKIFFVGVLKVTDERAGSGSVSQRYGSDDPDPQQNVTDPEHCCSGTPCVFVIAEDILNSFQTSKCLFETNEFKKFIENLFSHGKKW